MSVLETCLIRKAERLSEGIYSLALETSRIASLASCGQFVHIACSGDRLLRRPISICMAEGNILRVVFQVKGDGTRWLSERRAGDSLDILGPLGHGFHLPALGASPVFVGGGIGVPPMLYAMRCASEAGAAPQAVLGFRSQNAVILEDECRRLGETTVATDDGTYGVHGFVTDVLSGLLDKVTGIAACGPRPMLKAVAGIAKAAGLPCQVSLEERMGCGIGACLVCACALKTADDGIQYGHVCKDGPVFDAEEVFWS